MAKKASSTARAKNKKVLMWTYSRPMLSSQVIACGPNITALMDAIRADLEAEDETTLHGDFRISRVMMSDAELDSCVEFEGW